MQHVQGLQLTACFWRDNGSILWCYVNCFIYSETNKSSVEGFMFSEDTEAVILEHVDDETVNIITMTS